MVTYPEDWKEFRFKDTGIEVSKGQVITRADVRIGEIPVVAGGMEPAYYCDKYNRDGFTVTISASGANAGYVNLYKGKIFASDCSTISEAPNYDVRYIYYLLLNKQNEIYDAQTGGAQPHIHPKDIYKLPIVYTSNISEQQAIASALSDFDEHIDNLSDLIEKKKAIRDGALEDLVSGRTRLDGFNGEWVEMTLEDICVPNGLVRGPFGGSLKKEMFVSKGNKVYEQRNAIYKSVRIGDYYISNEKYDELSRFAVKADDFIVSCSGTIGKIFKIPKQYKRGVINQALLKISIDQTKCNLNYFYKYFEWDKFQDSIIDNTQGGAMKNLVGMDVFRKTVILMPRDIAEQKAIAQIISAMDEEIESLKIEKDKMIQIKEGAMDDLLTGRVRLKV
ncbi:restriction endonuclease subunit S [Erysipelothrix rhusiopathiae]|nr:restriction endonuclease subunit S [Erysipelothrix rhusiopathiae]MDE8295288.1 restriction endonuclease subunit S [Erysipelothrix rhusiopathiae]